MSRCQSAITRQLDLGKVPLASPAVQDFLKGASLVFIQKLRLQARNGAFDEAKLVLNHCYETGIPELLMKNFTISYRRQAPELGHDSGISEEDILRFCFEPVGDYAKGKRVLALESSEITSHFVERLLDYAARKEYDYGIKLVVLANEPQKALEDRNKLWHVSVEGCLVFFSYKYTKHARMHKFFDL
ncbi:hypothetical protein AAVH_23821 [Aphelenchoides avenae]|nr:hypothetical protein AAVH_23821 [Aphelenchus avenae]